MEWAYLPEEELWEQPWVARVLRGPYSSKERRLFLMVASFGHDGCWLVNAQITEELSCSDGTVRRAIKKLQSGGDLLVTGNKGHKRRMYPARAPGIHRTRLVGASRVRPV
ncbi:hypothetical protein ES705_15678 [subsurface metagenome]